MANPQDTDNFQVISSTGRVIQDGDKFQIGPFEEYGSIITFGALCGSGYTYTQGAVYTLETIDGIKYIKDTQGNWYLAINDEDETTFSEELPEKEFRIRIVQDKRFKSIMSLATWDGDERFGIEWVKAMCGVIRLSYDDEFPYDYEFRFQFKLI
ncbi:hypothetical protein GQ54DRAFT_300546 [Martensiomyces pterosporus]|nr:hypothetical protein GQ54DRAFT_300546 [Martensiomyces pterosporus]